MTLTPKWGTAPMSEHAWRQSLWPTLAKPSLAKSKFGQNQVLPNQPFLANLTRIGVLMFWMT